MWWTKTKLQNGSQVNFAQKGCSEGSRRAKCSEGSRRANTAAVTFSWTSRAKAACSCCAFSLCTSRTSLSDTAPLYDLKEAETPGMHPEQNWGPKTPNDNDRRVWTYRQQVLTGSGGIRVDIGLSPNLSDVGTSQPRGIFHATPCLWEGKQSTTPAVQEGYRLTETITTLHWVRKGYQAESRMGQKLCRHCVL